MNFIIGVPVNNDLDCLKEMTFSLLNSTKAYLREKIVFAVGENCNEETKSWLNQFKSNSVNVEIKNGFKTPLEAYNYLFNLAKERKTDLFLTQTDVIFPKLYRRDWLYLFSEVAQNENVGAVTCLNGGGISGPDYVDGFKWLGGWCVYYPLRTLEKVGGFDENFPNGNGVDIAHSYRIVQSGLKIIIVNNYWVDHHMMNERPHDNNPNAEADRQASAKYFRKQYLGLD